MTDVIPEFPGGFFTPKDQITSGAPTKLDNPLAVDNDFIKLSEPIPAGQYVREDRIDRYEYDPHEATDEGKDANGCTIWKVVARHIRTVRKYWITSTERGDIKIDEYEELDEKVARRVVVCPTEEGKVIREEGNWPTGVTTPKPAGTGDSPPSKKPEKPAEKGPAAAPAPGPNPPPKKPVTGFVSPPPPATPPPGTKSEGPLLGPDPGIIDKLKWIKWYVFGMFVLLIGAALLLLVFWQALESIVAQESIDSGPRNRRAG